MQGSFDYCFSPDDYKLPPNVIARRWLPQQSLLKHPKVLLYFGHGGINGLHEAVHFRKPIVGLPVWADGEDNVAHLQRKGVAVMLKKGDNADTIYNAIIRVRDDPRYTYITIRTKGLTL